MPGSRGSSCGRGRLIVLSGSQRHRWISSSLRLPTVRLPTSVSLLRPKVIDSNIRSSKGSSQTGSLAPQNHSEHNHFQRMLAWSRRWPKRCFSRKRSAALQVPPNATAVPSWQPQQKPLPMASFLCFCFVFFSPTRLLDLRSGDLPPRRCRIWGRCPPTASPGPLELRSSRSNP